MSNINLVNTPASSVSTPVAGKTQLFIDDTGTLSTKDSSGAVTPVGAGIPDQSGHAGEFLTTNGTTASWAAVGGGSSAWGNTSGSGFWASNPTTPVNPAVAGSTTSIAIGDTAVADYGGDTTVIGHAASAYGFRNLSVGNNANAGFFGANDGVAIGYSSSAGEQSIAIGSTASSLTGNGIAIGYGVNCGVSGICIGNNAATTNAGEALIVPGGYFSTNTDISTGFAQWWMRTTNDTPTALKTGTMGQINATPSTDQNHADGSIISYITDIVAKDEAGGNYASWTYQYTIYVASGASTIMGTPTLLSSSNVGSGSTWSVAITASGTQALVVATGEAGKNIRWAASAKMTKVA